MKYMKHNINPKDQEKKSNYKMLIRNLRLKKHEKFLYIGDTITLKKGA